MNENIVSVRVWGDFACFTRPEMKVERVSYPIITPSAARGVLEAIFWEPEMYYKICEIRVVKKGKWFSVKRNEVKEVINTTTAGRWMRDFSKFKPIQAGGGAADGTQRNTLGLADVEYIITAEISLSGVADKGKCNIPKYRDEIMKRAAKGKCYHRPALGCREFPADFEWENDSQAALERRANELGLNWRDIWPSEDLGIILYDVFAPAERSNGFRWLKPEEIISLPQNTDGKIQKKNKKSPIQSWSGKMLIPQAIFFKAFIENSKMLCHPDKVELIVGETGRENAADRSV